MTTYRLNEKRNGVEILFDGKPGEIVRDELKKAGFRWNQKGGYWYAVRTADRVDLARRLSKAATVTRAEGKAQAQAARLTVERMNQISEQYTFRATGAGLYAGWNGCNSATHLYGLELKNAILAELKKNGIRATASQRRGGYTDSFTFSVRVPEECQVGEEKYIADRMGQAWGGRSWWTGPDGRLVFRDDLFTMPAEECDAIRRETYRTEYRNACQNGGDAIASQDFRALVATIVSSFNSDHSNSMTDYFDVGFYAKFKWIA